MNNIRDINTQAVFLKKEIGRTAFDPMAFLNQSKTTQAGLSSRLDRDIYKESDVNSLLDEYRKHKRLAEEYESVIAETDSRVSDLIIRLVIAFLIVIVLTAFLFSKFF